MEEKKKEGKSGVQAYLNFSCALSFMNSQKPVILVGCMDYWPALADPQRKWSDLNNIKVREGRGRREKGERRRMEELCKGYRSFVIFN
jgi:hypothetical protein